MINNCFFSLDIAPQVMIFMPQGLRNTVSILWDRLIESGITMYHQSKTIATYKMIRSEWLNAVSVPNYENSGKNEDALSSNLKIMLFVLGLGYSAAGFAFCLELLWAKFTALVN